jgi:hypothetical protein
MNVPRWVPRSVLPHGNSIAVGQHILHRRHQVKKRGAVAHYPVAILLWPHDGHPEGVVADEVRGKETCRLLLPCRRSTRPGRSGGQRPCAHLGASNTSDGSRAPCRAVHTRPTGRRTPAHCGDSSPQPRRGLRVSGPTTEVRTITSATTCRAGTRRPRTTRMPRRTRGTQSSPSPRTPQCANAGTPHSPPPNPESPDPCWAGIRDDEAALLAQRQLVNVRATKLVDGLASHRGTHSNLRQRTPHEMV